MRRLVLALGSGLACWFAGGSVSAAQAAPLPSEAVNAKPEADDDAASRAGFEVLANLGYGASTTKVGRIEFQPYALSFGINVGYGWRSGFRLGAEFGYGLGRSVAQRRTSRIGDDFDVTSDASSLSGGISLGYDVPLHFLVLRYSLGLGLASMNWDLSVPPETFFDEDSLTNPALGLYVAPGAILFWRQRALELGVGFDYLVQTNTVIPTGFVGKLVAGVKW